MRYLLSIFKPPIAIDKEQTREASFTHFILLSIIIGLCYSLTHDFDLSNFGQTHFKLISIAAVIFLFFLNKINKLKLPFLALSIIGMVICLGLMLLDQGISDEIVLAFPIILFLASLKFERFSLLVILIIQILIIGILGYLEIIGVLKNEYSHATDFPKIGSLIVILIITAFIVDLLINDVRTYLKKLEINTEELELSNLKLNESNATKDKFFSIIAHDLRSPFQGLLGIASILENLDDELTDLEKKDFVKRLNIALKRQYDFLEELLLWGKFQRDAIEFEPSTCDLKDIVNSNYEILTENIERKKINFSVKSSESIFAKCDENLISTVIRNLLSNAIKFTPAGGKVKVHIYLESGKAFVDVIDTGIGLTEKRKNELFKIETNASTRGTEDEAGSGLGLILCKEIMIMHKGDIKVKSEEGKGSTFSIMIPQNLN